MSYLRSLAGCLLLCAAVHAQSGLPAAPAPAAPAKPDFTPPANTPHTVIQSSGPPPEAPIEELFCDAPATGSYAPQNSKFTSAQETAFKDYYYLVLQQVFGEWRRHVPLSAVHAWTKGRFLEVRFAIMPDGSYDSPIITASSGHTDWDVHAIAAVNNYASFPPLPAGINHPVPICIHLGYKIPPPKKTSGSPTTSPFPNPNRRS